MLIGIASIADGVNTARYFETSVLNEGHQLRRVAKIDSCDIADLDLLLVVDPMLKNPETLKLAPCPVVGILIDVHQQSDVRLAYARYFDYVFVAQLDYRESFQNLPHPSAHWLPLGCDPDVHFLSGVDRSNDVGFVGKLGAPNTKRREVLDRVLGRFQTNDFMQFYNPQEMGEVYSRSKVVFNKSINGDVNMRVFEALAAGALLVTDRIGNGLESLAIEGVHYVGYDTAEEAERQIIYYLTHEAERRTIAAAGQKLVFERHTYTARLREILDVVARDPTAKAPARTADIQDEIAWRSLCYRLQGAGLWTAASVLAEGGWSARSCGNLALAVMRGIVRPMRQRLARR